MLVNEKTLLVRYQPEQRAFIPICGPTGAGPEGRYLTLRVKVVVQRVQLQKHELF